jgi:hypothetical protein
MSRRTYQVYPDLERIRRRYEAEARRLIAHVERVRDNALAERPGVPPREVIRRAVETWTSELMRLEISTDGLLVLRVGRE